MHLREYSGCRSRKGVTCMSKPSVLFLCTGNSCRSQMAEGLLRHEAGEQFEVFSAGFQPEPIHPLTERAMEELGIDMSRHYSKSSRDFLGHVKFDYLIIVCEDWELTCPRMFPGAHVRWVWPFEDPSECEGPEWVQMEKFREVRDAIADKLHLWLQVVPTP